LNWILGPTFAGLVIAVVVAFLMPDTYESVARMRIAPQSVPEQLVPSTVTIRLDQRLQGLRTTILSRTNLGTMITDPKLDLYKKMRARYPLDDAIEKMAKDVKLNYLDPDAVTERRFARAFEIRFSYPDRNKAQAVVSRLVSEFNNANARLQQTSATQTEGFLTDEKSQAKANLDRLNEQIAQFREQHLGRLPEDAMFNVQQLNNLQMSLRQVNDNQRAAQQQRNALETSLQSQTTMRDLVARSLDENTPEQTVKNQRLINMDTKIGELETQIASAQEFYSDDWPNLKSMKIELDSLKKRREEEQAKQDQTMAALANSATPPKPRSAGQRAQLQSIDNTIQDLKTQIQNTDLTAKQIAAEKQQLQSQISAAEARIQSSPVVEQQFSQLSREYSLAKDRYDQMVKAEQWSSTARNLEDRGAGETLEVVDQASLPQEPTDPNRWLIVGIGTGLGLFAGLLLAGAREAKDTSLKNLKDVRAYTRLPVLSSVPLLENALIVRRRRRLVWLAWSAAVMAGAIAVVVAVWIHYSPAA
jgi:polysaccharide chain length determinant protein (PEP-CTERM system associated)